MILSASRRTDIPAFYSEWFFNRIKEGFVCVRNPMNIHQVSRIKITPDVTDCIVFWTKNPQPMLERLEKLKDYMYYFQYTLNAYEGDIEPHVPKLEKRIDTFKKLSEIIGPERVIWRYDPVFFSDRYSVDYHLNMISMTAEKLKGYTEKCVFSFLDIYPQKNLRNIREHRIRNADENEMQKFLEGITETAKKNNIILATCAEQVDLSRYGIEHNSCIDGKLIERLTGCTLKSKPDGQRGACQCVKCEEIGTYDTCPHGCIYCYANYRPEITKEKLKQYNPDSPILCDIPDTEKDKITDRPVKSLLQKKEEPVNDEYEQLSLF